MTRTARSTRPSKRTAPARRLSGPAVLAVLAVLTLGVAGCGGGGADAESTGASSAGPASPEQSQSSEPTEPAGPRLMLPVPGPAFEVGGACPDVLVTRGDAGEASYVLSDPAPTVQQWRPEFEGTASAQAESDEPVFTAGVTSAGDPFLAAALVTDDVGAGALEADQTRLEVTTLDTVTGQPVGPPVAVAWDPAQPVPELPPCVSDRLGLEAAVPGAGFTDPGAAVFDLSTGEQVLDEPLATAENTSLAVTGDRVLATLASTYEAVQNTGQAPVAAVGLSESGGGAPEVVIGGNAFDYDYFGADATWIPGVVGGDKQPTATSQGLAYESYTFPATGDEPFVTEFDTVGTVLDFWDPATGTKLMVATNPDDGASSAAAIDYETGQAEPLDWFPADPAALGFQIHGFYDGNIWATSKDRNIVLSTDGDEVPEAADWVTFPQYAGQGWAVLASAEGQDTTEVTGTTGVLFPGDFDPALTTQPVEEFE